MEEDLQKMEVEEDLQKMGGKLEVEELLYLMELCVGSRDGWGSMDMENVEGMTRTGFYQSGFQ